MGTPKPNRWIVHCSGNWISEFSAKEVDLLCGENGIMIVTIVRKVGQFILFSELTNLQQILLKVVGKFKKSYSPNGALMVIYHDKRQTKTPWYKQIQEYKPTYRV